MHHEEDPWEEEGPSEVPKVKANQMKVEAKGESLEMEVEETVVALLLTFV